MQSTPPTGVRGVNPDLRIAGTRAPSRLRPIKDRRRCRRSDQHAGASWTPTLTGSVVSDAASDRMAVPKIATAAERGSEGRQIKAEIPREQESYMPARPALSDCEQVLVSIVRQACNQGV